MFQPVAADCSVSVLDGWCAARTSFGRDNGGMFQSGGRLTAGLTKLHPTHTPEFTKAKPTVSHSFCTPHASFKHQNNKRIHRCFSIYRVCLWIKMGFKMVFHSVRNISARAQRSWHLFQPTEETVVNTTLLEVVLQGDAWCIWSQG
jgi:hypothetical protein